ncbi:MAG: type I methionyl aminopeptidase [Opitutales bacterium]
MIPIKTEAEIAQMRQACRIAATVLARLAERIEPGITTYDLDSLARDMMESYGARSACFNYGVGSRRPFPGHTCISVNEEIVHGIPSMKRTLRDGDLVTLDVCIVHEGWIGDNACTYAVGQASKEADQLLKISAEALHQGIAQVKPGNRIGHVSNAIQRHIEGHGLNVVREFVGHGVGRSMHEEPQIPNYGRVGSGAKLREGMTLAIEPMVSAGNGESRVAADGWTAVTVDGADSAHFEHTVLVTEAGFEILTTPEDLT